MSTAYIAIMQLLDDLTEEKYEEIYNLLINTVDFSSKGATGPVFTACVSCGSKYVVRNGKSRCGKQTYLCRSCGKSFTETTGSVIAYSHQPMAAWDKVIRDTYNGVSLHDTARAIGVSFPTVFSMRHKVMYCIEDQAIKDKEILTDTHETDETYFLESFKGTKLIPGIMRAPRKRGSKSSKRGLSRDRICVCTSIGPMNKSYARSVNRAAPSGADLVKVFAHKVKTDTVLLCDGKTAYDSLDPYCTVAHVKRVNKINGLHNFMKFRVNKLAHGVATKYLNRYNAILSSAYANNKDSGIKKARAAVTKRDSRFVTIHDLRYNHLLIV